ncbi:polyamine transporter [Truncatella angustata]|uniref:Polyamine transporter n=1 Tax=Truncatella angustata TaxID=152316 RepID=A0A9P8UBY8_9PEZI|nr:polyamine transporter [Truncatella angustata]KAH6645112.1 polyamine transporter [Truncatella angustata]
MTAKEETEHMENGLDSVEEVDGEKPGISARSDLIPQPTNDPNDPLNWPTREKYATYLTISFFTLLSTINSSNFSVAISPVSKEFGVTTTQAGYLVCFNVLAIGLGNLFWVALMRCIGKRPIYLVSLLLMTGSNVWSYEAGTYASLLASRIVSGFACAAADATVPAVVADLFFVHERGHWMMIYHLALSGGFFLGPLIMAYIVQGAGWRWMCGVLAIAGAATFVVGIFTIRESTYKRAQAEATLPASAYPAKRTIVQNLDVLRGINREESFWGIVWNMVVMMAYLPITWTGFTIGVFVGWNIVVQLTASQTFIKPPYSFSQGEVGLLSLSGFVGACLAFFFGGKLIDLIATRMTRAKGRREPEYRLPAILIPALVGPAGILVFGLCVAHKTAWIGAAVGYAMQGFGLTAVGNVVVTYSVDGYQSLAGEALVVVFVIRNTIGMLLALYTYNWQAASGVQNTFGEMVGIQFLVLLLAIPMYFYGKRVRQWTSTFGPAKHVFRPNE